jgi:hypothetical protein
MILILTDDIIPFDGTYPTPYVLFMYSSLGRLLRTYILKYGYFKTVSTFPSEIEIISN